jgi:hypothetical protein
MIETTRTKEKIRPLNLTLNEFQNMKQKTKNDQKNVPCFHKYGVFWASIWSQCMFYPMLTYPSIKFL